MTSVGFAPCSQCLRTLLNTREGRLVNEMQIIKNPSKETWAAMLKRPTIDTVFLERTVANILKDVREHGDSALRHCARHFDKVELLSLIHI